MTVVIDLDDPAEWFERRDLFSEEVFSFPERSWPNRGSVGKKVEFEGLASDLDTIYRTELESECELENSDIVRSILKNEKVVAEAVHTFEFIGKFRRKHLVDQYVFYHDEEEEYLDEEAESKKLEEDIREALTDEGMIEGEVRGSAQEIFVQRE